MASSGVSDSDRMTLQTSSNRKFEKTNKDTRKKNKATNSSNSSSRRFRPASSTSRRRRQPIRSKRRQVVPLNPTDDGIAPQPLTLNDIHRAINECYSGVGPFKCPFNCGKDCERSRDAARHAYNHCPLRDPDLAAPVLDCPVCLKPVSCRMDAVQRHINAKHSGEVDK